MKKRFISNIIWKLLSATRSVHNIFHLKITNYLLVKLETNRVTECPRCQNEIFSDGALYCRICGLELVNESIPFERDDNGNYINSEPYDNSPDARFCEQCGAPTVYFQKHELLKSYEEILG